MEANQILAALTAALSGQSGNRVPTRDNLGGLTISPTAARSAAPLMGVSSVPGGIGAAAMSRASELANESTMPPPQEHLPAGPSSSGGKPGNGVQDIIMGILAQGKEQPWPSASSLPARQQQSAAPTQQPTQTEQPIIGQEYIPGGADADVLPAPATATPVAHGMDAIIENMLKPRDMKQSMPAGDQQQLTALTTPRAERPSTVQHYDSKDNKGIRGFFRGAAELSTGAFTQREARELQNELARRRNERASLEYTPQEQAQLDLLSSEKKGLNAVNAQAGVPGTIPEDQRAAATMKAHELAGESEHTNRLSEIEAQKTNKADSLDKFTQEMALRYPDIFTPEVLGQMTGQAVSPGALQNIGDARLKEDPMKMMLAMYMSEKLGAGKGAGAVQRPVGIPGAAKPAPAKSGQRNLDALKR